MPTNAETHGTAFAWGAAEGTPPVVSGLTVTKWEVNAEPAVFSEAMDGEGMAIGVAVTKATHRKLNLTVTGYIPASPTGAANAIANTLTFIVNSVSRFFILSKIGEPHPKGDYVEVSAEYVSHKLVGS